MDGHVADTQFSSFSAWKDHHIHFSLPKFGTSLVYTSMSTTTCKIEGPAIEGCHNLEDAKKGGEHSTLVMVTVRSAAKTGHFM
jgi:hypothetical protein